MSQFFSRGLVSGLVSQCLCAASVDIGRISRRVIVALVAAGIVATAQSVPYRNSSANINDSRNESHLGEGPTMPSSPANAAMVLPRLTNTLDPQPLSYAVLPIGFEANQGQTADQVKFLARGRGYLLFLTSNEMVLSLRGSFLPVGGTSPAVEEVLGVGQQRVTRQKDTTERESLSSLRISLSGANPKPAIEGDDLLPGKSNYFIGNDPREWRTNVASYAKVKYQDVYAGIDLVYYGNQGRLEHDFVVAPGADPREIRLKVDGARRIALDAQGNLKLGMPGGEVTLQAPVAYQEINETRHDVPARYTIHGNKVGFRIGDYDRERRLTIDPVLVYATYVGGSSNDYSTAGDLHVDSAGNAYFCGLTYSANFPTTSGAFQPSLRGGYDAFVTKLNPSGSALVYSTFLGGTGLEGCQGSAIDSAGNAYVAISTNSTDFPTTAGAFMTTYPGSGPSRWAVAKLDSSGSLVYATYLGGTCCENGPEAIAVDTSGNAYIGGWTQATDFPTTSGALQPTYPGGPSSGVLAKLNASGSGLVYSTFFGGPNPSGITIYGVAVDSSGNAYIVGSASGTIPTTTGAFQTTFGGGTGNGFVAKLDPTGSTLVYSTYVGGSSYDFFEGIAIDAAGNAYATGAATSSNFPVTGGAYQTGYAGNTDASVVKLNPTGTALVYSTYLGGPGDDVGGKIAVDSTGRADVLLNAYTGSFPTTANALQGTFPGGRGAVVAQLDASGSSLLYASYVGGNGDNRLGGIAVDSTGAVYFDVDTDAADAPTTAGAFQATNAGGHDLYVGKIQLSFPLTITANNAARLYGSANPAFTFTTAGLMNGDTLASIGVSPTCATAAIGSSPAGSYPITCAGPASTTNYTITYVPGTLTVTRVPLTITANNAQKVLDAPNPAFSATYAGFVNGDTAASLSGILNCTTTATTTSPVGSYPITCSAQSSNNYTITYVAGTFTIQYAGGGVCDGDAGHQILQPINADGTSVWNQGRIIPVKFRVCDANGVSIGAAGVISSFVLTQIISGTVTTVDEGIDATVADAGFRFDTTGQQWIFNLSSKPESAGFTYVYSINLNDGTSIVFQYGLR